MSNFQPQPREKNAFDNAALKLVGVPENGNKAPQLAVNITKNRAVLTVFTNDPNDTKDYGKIRVQLTGPYFNAVLYLLEQAAQGKLEGGRKFIEIKDFAFPGGKRTEQPIVLGRVIVGRDEDGLVWISVTANGRPNCKFPLIPQTYNTVRNADSSEVSRAEHSQIYAMGWAQSMKTLWAQLAVLKFEEYIPKGGGNGGNRGGYNGGGGGYNNNNGGGGNSNGGGYGGGNSGGNASTSVDSFDGW